MLLNLVASLTCTFWTLFTKINIELLMLNMPQCPDLLKETLRGRKQRCCRRNTYTLHKLNLLPGTYMMVAVQGNAIIARTKFIVAK